MSSRISTDFCPQQLYHPPVNTPSKHFEIALRNTGIAGRIGDLFEFRKVVLDSMDDCRIIVPTCPTRAWIRIEWHACTSYIADGSFTKVADPRLVRMTYKQSLDISLSKNPKILPKPNVIFVSADS